MGTDGNEVQAVAAIILKQAGAEEHGCAGMERKDGATPGPGRRLAEISDPHAAAPGGLIGYEAEKITPTQET